MPKPTRPRPPGPRPRTSGRPAGKIEPVKPRKPVKGSPNSVMRAGERRDAYGERGANIGTIAGMVPFAAGNGAGSLNVSPLILPGMIAGRVVGRRIGHGVAHVANLATLLRPDQFRDYL